MASYAVPLMIKNGLKAQAVIVPTKVFGQLSFNNFRRKVDALYDLQYFDDEAQAKAWLMTQKKRI